MLPFVVFSRVHVNDQLKNDFPLGVWAKYHSSDWMQSEIFLS